MPDSPRRRADRVTAFELLFDLVYVFVITQLVGLVDSGGAGLLHAVVLLPLSWFCWSSFAWLGNLARADEGSVRVALIVGMAAMFFLAVAVPNAFAHARISAVVLVVAYAVAAATSLTTSTIASGFDRRIGLLAGAGLATTVALLGVGLAADGTARVAWWLAAIVVQIGGIGAVSNERWQVHSPGHFTERFGLVILIALGENLVEAGTNVSEHELSARLAIGLLCVLALTIGLWWLYFDAFTAVAERVLETVDGARRARLARDGFAYIHLLMTGGIVAAAAGMALLLDDDATRHGSGRWLLDAGIALYLAAHVTFRVRAFRSLHPPRLLAIVVLLVGGALPDTLDPLVQLAWPTATIVVLVTYEIVAYRQWRRAVRSDGATTPVAPMTRAAKLPGATGNRA